MKTMIPKGGHEPKASIVVPALNSHEPWRRNLLWLRKILPRDVELILIDDGSEPPLKIPAVPWTCEVKMVHTRDFRPWTHLIAFTRGVEMARSENIIRAEVDHILTPEAIEWAKEWSGIRANFWRKVGALSEEGELITDKETLLPLCSMGKFAKYLNNDSLSLAPIYIINRTKFLSGCNYDLSIYEGQWPTDAAEAHLKIMIAVKEFLGKCNQELGKHWSAFQAPREHFIYVDPRCNSDYFHSLKRVGEK